MTNATPEFDPADKAGKTSLGQLLSEVTRDISTLIRQEIELAKAELRDSATKAGKSAGLFGSAGIAGHMALLFLTIAVWWALGDAIGRAWSGLVVAVVYAIITLILFLVARKQMQSIQGMPRTAKTVKRIPEALKPEETR